MFHSALMKKTFQLFERNNQLINNSEFCIRAFHFVFHYFHGLMNSINWPSSIVWVFIAQLVEHCSTTQRPQVRIPLKPRKTFFRATSQLLKLRFNCDGRTFISQVYLHGRPLVRCTFYGSFSKTTLGS